MRSKRVCGLWALTALSFPVPWGCAEPARPPLRAPGATVLPAPALPVTATDDGSEADAPVAPLPACPAPPAPEHRTLLSIYRDAVGAWLGERREALERVPRGPREGVSGEGALARANDSALWLQLELGERLIDPVASKVAHPAVQRLLREVRAQPAGRRAGPLVAIGGMGGTLDLAGCDDASRWSTPSCERARAAYRLLDFHAVRLLPNLTWQTYRPPDFEAEEAQPVVEPSLEPGPPSGPPPCPPPRKPEVGFAFTRVFDVAIEAGMRRTEAERVAVELFSDLAARVEGDAVAQEADTLRRAYVVAVHRVLTEAERARLAPLPAREPSAPFDSEAAIDALSSLLAWGGSQSKVDVSESGTVGACPVDSYRQFRLCAEPFVYLSGACPATPLGRMSACVHDAYVAHVVASLRALVRREAPEATLTSAFEELLRFAEKNAGSRARFVDRVVEGHQRLHGPAASP